MRKSTLYKLFIFSFFAMYADAIMAGGMTYPQWVYHIIMYGGALVILLFIAISIAIIVLLIRANRMITSGQQAVKTVTNSIMIPFMSLAAIVTPLLQGKAKSSSRKTKNS